MERTLKEELKLTVDALQEITLAQGAFARDHATHAENVISDMQGIAINVLKELDIEPVGTPIADN